MEDNIDVPALEGIVKNNHIMYARYNRLIAQELMGMGQKTTLQMCLEAVAHHKARTGLDIEIPKLSITMKETLLPPMPNVNDNRWVTPPYLEVKAHEPKLDEFTLDMSAGHLPASKSFEAYVSTFSECIDKWWNKARNEVIAIETKEHPDPDDSIFTASESLCDYSPIAKQEAFAKAVVTTSLPDAYIEPLLDPIAQLMTEPFTDAPCEQELPFPYCIEFEFIREISNSVITLYNPPPSVIAIVPTFRDYFKDIRPIIVVDYTGPMFVDESWSRRNNIAFSRSCDLEKDYSAPVYVGFFLAYVNNSNYYSFPGNLIFLCYTQPRPDQHAPVIQHIGSTHRVNEAYGFDTRSAYRYGPNYYRVNHNMKHFWDHPGCYYNRFYYTSQFPNFSPSEESYYRIRVIVQPQKWKRVDAKLKRATFSLLRSCDCDDGEFFSLPQRWSLCIIEFLPGCIRYQDYDEDNFYYETKTDHCYGYKSFLGVIKEQRGPRILGPLENSAVEVLSNPIIGCIMKNPYKLPLPFVSANGPQLVHPTTSILQVCRGAFRMQDPIVECTASGDNVPLVLKPRLYLFNSEELLMFMRQRDRYSLTDVDSVIGNDHFIDPRNPYIMLGMFFVINEHRLKPSAYPLVKQIKEYFDNFTVFWEQRGRSRALRDVVIYQRY